MTWICWDNFAIYWFRVSICWDRSLWWVRSASCEFNSKTSFFCYANILPW